MTMRPDQECDDVLDELRTALDVGPSPEFAARVRRVASARRVRASGIRIWSLGAAAGVVVIAGVTAVVMTSRTVPESVRIVGGTGTPPPFEPVRTGERVSARGSRAHSPGPRLEPANPLEPAEASPVRGIAAFEERAGTRDEHVAPQVLIPPGQLEALHQLLVAIREGRAEPPRRPAEDPVTGELVPPVPLEIPSVEIPPVEIVPIAWVEDARGEFDEGS